MNHEEYTIALRGAIFLNDKMIRTPNSPPTELIVCIFHRGKFQIIRHKLNKSRSIFYSDIYWFVLVQFAVLKANKTISTIEFQQIFISVSIFIMARKKTNKMNLIFNSILILADDVLDPPFQPTFMEEFECIWTVRCLQCIKLKSVTEIWTCFCFLRNEFLL